MERLFWKVTSFPKTIVASWLLIVMLLGAFLPRLTKDTRTESFIPPHHPAVVYRNKVKAIFGLSDPVVVAVFNDGPNGVFTPASLQLVQWLTERIQAVDGVDPERVTSLATESNVVGTADGMVVAPFFSEIPATQEEADQLRAAVMDFPLYVGSLVARDGRATLIVAELLDASDGGKVYAEFLALAEKAPTHGEQLHIAGDGAATAYLESYIDADMMWVNPLVALVITGVLLIAYRTLRGALLPNLVVVSAAIVAVGGMAATGVPFYLITSALPVILVAIGVADGIHILGQYYEEMAHRPQAPPQEIVVRAMTDIWRPVMVTSLTDIAGFLAIATASFMPPMQAFGLFAALGVFAAMLFSTIVLPAILVLLRPQLSPAFRPSVSASSGADTHIDADGFARVMGVARRWVMAYPRTVLIGAGVVAVAGVGGILQLEVNGSRIDQFQADEPIALADRAINRVLDGTNYLDIIIETREAEGLLEPQHLRRIEALQTYLETLPHVRGTTSIVDYLKQMNRAVHEGRADAYQLPASADLSAQYFLLYSMTGDPTDFEDKIDYDYRLANVRAAMDNGLYIDQKIVIEAAETYIREQFNTPEITARLAGRVNVDYHWLSGLLRSHFRGLTLAFIAVWIMGALSFRSFVAGTLMMIPVSMALLLIYAVMGFGGIRLEVGTSMFAAIAIGLSVDFAIHTLDRLITILRAQGQAFGEAFGEAFVASFSGTGRALFFNFSAVLLGFGVLLTSHIPSVISFGCLVGVSVTASFVASQTILPAIVCVFRPRLFGPPQSEPRLTSRARESRVAKAARDHTSHVQETDLT